MKTLPLTPYSLREWLRVGGAKAPAHSRVLIVYQRLSLIYLHERQPASHICVLRRPGGYGGAAAPDPIPNSAVKRSSANGTLS